MCIYSLILSYVLRQFELKLGQKSPYEEGENWWIGIFWVSGTSLVSLPWCGSFGSKTWLAFFALICKEGWNQMMKSLLLWCLLQLLVLLAECCHSYLGRMDLRDEKRINKILENGSLFLVFPGRSRTRTVLWLLFFPRYMGKKEWARISHPFAVQFIGLKLRYFVLRSW